MRSVPNEPVRREYTTYHQVRPDRTLRRGPDCRETHCAHAQRARPRPDKRAGRVETHDSRIGFPILPEAASMLPLLCAAERIFPRRAACCFGSFLESRCGGVGSNPASDQQQLQGSSVLGHRERRLSGNLSSDRLGKCSAGSCPSPFLGGYVQVPPRALARLRKLIPAARLGSRQRVAETALTRAGPARVRDSRRHRARKAFIEHRAIDHSKRWQYSGG